MIYLQTLLTSIWIFRYLLAVKCLWLDLPVVADWCLRPIPDEWVVPRYREPILQMKVNARIRANAHRFHTTSRRSKEIVLKCPAGCEEVQIATLMATLEEIRNRVVAFMGSKPPRLIVSVVDNVHWPDRAFFKAYMDHSHYHTHILLSMQILQRSPICSAATLCHEYAHATIHLLAPYACPFWLDEGIAEYITTLNGYRPAPTPPHSKWLQVETLAQDRRIYWQYFKHPTEFNAETYLSLINAAHYIVASFVEACGKEELLRLLAGLEKGRMGRQIIEKLTLPAREKIGDTDSKIDQLELDLTNYFQKPR